MTAPTSLSSDFTEGKACTALDLRLVSPFVLSWTLLVSSLFQCGAEKPGHARASASVFDSVLSAIRNSEVIEHTWPGRFSDGCFILGFVEAYLRGPGYEERICMPPHAYVR